MKVTQSGPILSTITLTILMLSGCGGSGDGSSSNNNTEQNTENTTTQPQTDISLYVSQDTAYVIDQQGRLWGWGDNSTGELAQDPTLLNNAQTPQLIASDVISIQSVHPMGSQDGSVAILKSDHSLWMWGENERGSVGNGTTDFTFTPSKILDNVKKVDLQDGPAVFALTLEDDWFVWGYNNYQMLGITSADNTITQPTEATALANFESIASYRYSSWTIYNNDLYVWGANDNRQFQWLDPTEGNQIDTPTLMLEDIAEANITLSNSYALSSNGNYYFWNYETTRLVRNDVSKALFIPYSDSVAHFILTQQNSVVTNLDPADDNYNPSTNWFELGQQVKDIAVLRNDTNNGYRNIVFMLKQDNSLWFADPQGQQHHVTDNVASLDWQADMDILYFRTQDSSLYEIAFDIEGQYSLNHLLSNVAQITASDSLMLVETDDQRIWQKPASNSAFAEVLLPSL